MACSVHRVNRCGVLYCEGGERPPERSSCSLTSYPATCQALVLEEGAGYEPVPEGTKCDVERVSARSPLAPSALGHISWLQLSGASAGCDPVVSLDVPHTAVRLLDPQVLNLWPEGCAHGLLCVLGRLGSTGRVLKEPVLCSRGLKTFLFCKSTPRQGTHCTPGWVGPVLWSWWASQPASMCTKPGCGHRSPPPPKLTRQL